MNKKNFYVLNDLKFLEENIDTYLDKMILFNKKEKLRSDNTTNLLNISTDGCVLQIACYKRPKINSEYKVIDYYYEIIHGNLNGDCSETFDNLKDSLIFIEENINDFYNRIRIINRDEQINQFLVDNKIYTDKDEIWRYMLSGNIDDSVLDFFENGFYVCYNKKYNYRNNKFILNKRYHNLLKKEFIIAAPKIQSKKEKDCFIKLKNIYDDLVPQYNVPNTKYYCDYFSPKHNIVIEFLGDYYHGNLTKYSENEVNPTVKKTYKQLNEETCKKLKNLKKLNYVVSYIWENNFDNLKETDVKTIVQEYKDENIL